MNAIELTALAETFTGESYKFTNMKRFTEEFLSTLESTRGGMRTIPETEDGAFVFVDGKLVASPMLQGLKSSLIGNELHLELEKNMELKSPVKVLHIVGLDDVAAPSLSVKLNPFSKMTLLEEAKSSSSTYAQIAQTRVVLAPGSKLEHVQLDAGTESSLLHGSTLAVVDKDASYSNFIFHLNGKLQRRNLELKLTAPGAHGESYSLFLTSGNEHSDISTVIGHLAEDTTSNQIAKGILGGDSKGVFTGKIHIHPKAQRVVSGQLNKNLLLSKKAQVHSQPQLEIFADDVKCSHGSTTGQMSEEEVFYFETRGIPAERARTLLAFGFALEIVQKLKDEEVRKQVEALVMDTLKTKFHIGEKRS